MVTCKLWPLSLGDADLEHSKLSEHSKLLIRIALFCLTGANLPYYVDKPSRDSLLGLGTPSRGSTPLTADTRLLNLPMEVINYCKLARVGGGFSCGPFPARPFQQGRHTTRCARRPPSTAARFFTRNRINHVISPKGLIERIAARAPAPPDCSSPHIALPAPSIRASPSDQSATVEAIFRHYRGPPGCGRVDLRARVVYASKEM